jgi:hypothetical protein
MFADPKEIKKRRKRERYTLHRGEILKKRHEERDQKRAAAATLDAEDVES